MLGHLLSPARTQLPNSSPCAQLKIAWASAGRASMPNSTCFLTMACRAGSFPKGATVTK